LGKTSITNPTILYIGWEGEKLKQNAVDDIYSTMMLRSYNVFAAEYIETALSDYNTTIYHEPFNL